MRTLGRFHGVALAFNALDSKNFEKAADSLEETYYGEHTREWYTGFLLLAENVALDAVKKVYPDSKYETVAGNFLQPALFDDLINLVSTRSKLSVFGHGDCWTPNFLTKYNEQGESQEIIIIDFQLARCSSLALDLSFFIYSCTSQVLREEHYDKLLRAYLESAHELIKDLGGDPEEIITWESLQQELKDFGRFGCGMGIESLPMTMMEDEEVADLDGIKENAILTDIWNITPFKEPAKQNEQGKDEEELKVGVIVKAMPDNLHRRRLFRSVIFFRNEINFYTKVLPAIEAFQKSREPAPKKPFVEYPRCLASLCDGVNDFIALEDVGPKGYTAPVR